MRKITHGKLTGSSAFGRSFSLLWATATFSGVSLLSVERYVNAYATDF